MDDKLLSSDVLEREIEELIASVILTAAAVEDLSQVAAQLPLEIPAVQRDGLH